MWAATGGHCQGEKDFIGLRCVADPDLHGVQVRHNVDFVFVEEGDVDVGAGPPNFLGRRDDGLAGANGFSDRRAESGMHKGGRMLQFAGFANDTRLTVAFDLFGADHVQDTLDENCAEAFADVDQLGQVVNVAAGKGVCNHGDGRDFLDWCIEGPASFNQGFLLDRYLTSNFH